jgi:hypothetical protein
MELSRAGKFRGLPLKCIAPNAKFPRICLKFKKEALIAAEGEPISFMGPKDEFRRITAYSAIAT